MKKENYIKLSIALIVIGVFLRFIFAATHAVSGDACWHLSAAQFIATENKIPLFEGIGRLQPFWAPPVFHFVSAFLYKIFMPISLDLAGLGSKLASPIFGTLTVIILYLISRKLFDEKIAFYSMIFINFIPLFLDYSVFSFVGSTVAFFSILSVYFMLNNRYIFSSIALGLAILSKYNAVFVMPMLLYLAYKSSAYKKERLTKISTIAFLPLAISSVWFIRNFVLLKNPVWPFLNDIFRGIDLGTSFSTTNYRPLFSFETYLKSYLEIFGVPNGSLESLTFLNFPFLKLFVFIWLISTLIFIYPFIRSFFSKIKTTENKYFIKSIYVLFLSFLVMFVLYVLSLGWFGSRLLMPMMPFIAIMWALGLRSIKIEKFYLIVIIIIGLGFIAAETIKFSVAASEWDKYNQDFQWVKDNTAKKDLFYGNGQCFHYNTKRLVIDQKVDIDFNKVDYVWVNNKWRIDFLMNEKSLHKIKNSDILDIVYNNTNTGTVIYKVK